MRDCICDSCRYKLNSFPYCLECTEVGYVEADRMSHKAFVSGECSSFKLPMKDILGQENKGE